MNNSFHPPKAIKKTYGFNRDNWKCRSKFQSRKQKTNLMQKKRERWTTCINRKMPKRKLHRWKHFKECFCQLIEMLFPSLIPYLSNSHGLYASISFELKSFSSNWLECFCYFYLLLFVYTLKKISYVFKYRGRFRHFETELKSQLK